jgi:hypothetical protein
LAFVPVRQVLYYLSHASSPFCFGYFSVLGFKLAREALYHVIVFLVVLEIKGLFHTC